MNTSFKTRLLDIPSVIGLEQTYLTESFGISLVVVKKSKKGQIRKAINTVISDTLFPDS